MIEPLANAWAKLDWAKQHVAALDVAVKGWVNESDGNPPFDVGKEFDAELSCFVYRITAVQLLPVEWSLMAGDAVHDFRCALDHLAWQLVPEVAKASLKPRRLKQIQFPIETDSQNFDLPLLKKRLPDVASAHEAVVRQHQPYQWSTQAESHPFAVLNELSNRDKHRDLNLVFAQSFGHLSADLVSAINFSNTHVEPPTDLSALLMPTEGTEVARVFGIPTGDDFDVQVGFKHSLAPAFASGLWLIDTLNRIGATVTSLLSDIEPIL